MKIRRTSPGTPAETAEEVRTDDITHLFAGLAGLGDLVLTATGLAWWLIRYRATQPARVSA